ncbi:MAG: chromate transporter [Clostridia bacterium]|nr:chromate transporter [Clostridia bacterium]
MSKKAKTQLLLKLFLSFFKIGAFTFGGGYAMIALLENEFVEKKKWIEKNDFLDMIAIAESTPGPVAINSATYIGYKVGGVLGSILSTLAVVLPSLTIIYIISIFFDKFLSFEYVKYAFNGIKACVIYLIISAGIKMYKSLDKNAFNLIITFAVIVAMVMLTVFSISFSSIFIILICGILGVIAYFLSLAFKKGGNEK